MPKLIIFSEVQQTFIAENYLKVSIKDMAKLFNIDTGVISRYYKRNGFVVPAEVRQYLRTKKLNGRTTFTTAQDDFIRENYLILPIKKLGEKIGRSYTGVMSRLNQMGLTIPLEVIQRNKHASRIKKGNTPMNKGKKQTEYMTQAAIDLTAATRFKKGNRPHNTKEKDGEISIRHKEGEPPYKYIRISLSKWKLLQRYNWELKHGPIPKGHCLWCLGDTMNCNPDNWELITRKENRLRNTGWNKMDDRYIATTLSVRKPELRKELLNHPELLELKRNQLLLKRAINESTKI